MSEVDKVVALQECMFQPNVCISGLHVTRDDVTKVYITLANGTVISAKLADLEISKLQP